MQVIEEQATPYAMPSILVVHENGDRLTVELEYDDRVFSDGFSWRLLRKVSQIYCIGCVIVIRRCKCSLGLILCRVLAMASN